jgi:hypothetical protein
VHVLASLNQGRDAQGREVINGIHGSGAGGQLTPHERETADWMGRYLSGEMRGEGGQSVAASGGVAVHGASYGGAGFVTAAGNPLVSEIMSEAPGVYAEAAAAGPTPTLFPFGDLPDATDSGVPPATLMKLPWAARWPAMRLTRPSHVYDMIAEYAAMTPADAETAALRKYGGDVDNSAYRSAVSKWRLGAMSDQQVSDSIFGPDPQGAPEQNSNRFGVG